MPCACLCRSPNENATALLANKSTRNARAAWSLPPVFLAPNVIGKSSDPWRRTVASMRTAQAEHSSGGRRTTVRCHTPRFFSPLATRLSPLTLKLRDGLRVHHPAAAQVVALLADVCVVRLALRAASGPGRGESRREVAPGTAQHLLDQHPLDGRSDHEKIYDFGRPRQGHAQARRVVRRSRGGPLDPGQRRIAKLAGSLPTPAKGRQALESESSLRQTPGLRISPAAGESPWRTA